MTEHQFFNVLITAWFTLAGLVFVALFFVAAPYGRHTKNKWGAAVSSKYGWILMESTAPLVFLICFIAGPYTSSVTALIFLLMWEAHYIHRSYIYPLQIRGGQKPMALVVAAAGLLFNTLNGYINGRYIFHFSGDYSDSWILDPRFIFGLTLFILGFIINRQSDLILRTLRKPNETHYRIAGKGLYRWISCPNYLGEIIIWTGWAVATWSIAGLAFAVWTAANLVPRARKHHKWYKENFPDYPQERKALIPGIW
jgi:3-oxo-5-alpha-steroid 4-dehydrogenase 1